MNEKFDETVIINGVKMRSLNDMVVRSATDGKFEPETFAAWRKLVDPSGLMLDIGAYTGIYSIFSALMGNQCWAFEPNIHAYERLLENVELNGVRVKCDNLAVAESAGVGNLEMKAIPLTSSGHLGETGETVDVVSVDDAVPRHLKVSAVKIDVEGHELEVIRGARETLKTWRPLVVAEFLNDGLFDIMVEEMTQLGYRYPEILDNRNALFL